MPLENVPHALPESAEKGPPAADAGSDDVIPEISQTTSQGCADL